MKKFNIKIFDKKPKKIAGKLYYEGQIVIGDYSEKLFIPIDYWNIDQYKQQWQEGIDRLKTHETSCLIVSIKLFNNKIGTSLWILYKVGDTIFIQSHARSNDLNKELKTGFPPYNFLLPRKVPKRGRPDEWSISIDDFFNSQNENNKNKKD